MIDNVSVTAPSVIIVDDDHFVLTTLKYALEGLNIQVAGTTSSASGALSICRRTPVDVAVLDLDLGPGASGIDVAYALRKDVPTIGIVFLTSYTDPRLSDPLCRDLPKGAIFLTKSKLSQIETLVSAILTTYRSPVKFIANNLKTTNLTIRQIEVLKLLAEGVSTTEIANQLDVTEKAIEAMISKLYSKLSLESHKGINKRVQLARAYFSLAGKKPPGA